MLAKILNFPSVEHCPVCEQPTEWYDDLEIIQPGIDPREAVDVAVRRCSDCERTVTADGVVLSGY
jgi:hypothetical protein